MPTSGAFVGTRPTRVPLVGSAAYDRGVGMSERAVPFYCPYCGEEDLRPAEQTERVPHGAWYCAACLRTFALKMIGIGIAEVSR